MTAFHPKPTPVQGIKRQISSTSSPDRNNAPAPTAPIEALRNAPPQPLGVPELEARLVMLAERLAAARARGDKANAVKTQITQTRKDFARSQYNCPFTGNLQEGAPHLVSLLQLEGLTLVPTEFYRSRQVKAAWPALLMRLC